MKSMSRHMRPADFAAQLRMERQRHKGAFILLEGAHDIKRFKKFFDLSVSSIVNCYGKENVIGSVDLEQNSGHSDVVGFADVDFDKVLNAHSENDDIIFSAGHDFDIDVCGSDAICRYLDEMGDESKIGALGGYQVCVSGLLESLKPLSALRFANVRHNLRYSLQNLSHDQFFDGSAVNVDAMIEHVSDARFSSPAQKATLRQHIDCYNAAEFDLWQFTNGHDFFAGLGIALRSKLGTRNAPQTWRSEVEKHLRLTFDLVDFHKTGCLPKIHDWQNRSGYRILQAA